MYGRTYISTENISPGKNPIGVSSQSEGFNGPYTCVNGTMGYNEVCVIEFVLNTRLILLLYLNRPICVFA